MTDAMTGLDDRRIDIADALSELAMLVRMAVAGATAAAESADTDARELRHAVRVLSRHFDDADKIIQELQGYVAEVFAAQPPLKAPNAPDAGEVDRQKKRR